MKHPPSKHLPLKHPPLKHLQLQACAGIRDHPTASTFQTSLTSPAMTPTRPTLISSVSCPWTPSTKSTLRCGWVTLPWPSSSTVSCPTSLESEGWFQFYIQISQNRITEGAKCSSACPRTSTCGSSTHAAPSPNLHFQALLLPLHALVLVPLPQCLQRAQDH